MAQRFLGDFQGAAPDGVGIICLPSDEEDEMSDLSTASVLDVHLSSEDEEMTNEIMMMAKCVEMELSSPIPVPGPSTAPKIGHDAPGYGLPRYGTSESSFVVRPTLDQSFLSLGKGNGPIRRDDRVRNNHPIKLCREIAPMVDISMSPPPDERGTIDEPFPVDVQGADRQQSLNTVTNHFQGMGNDTLSLMVNYSDCVICGKSTMQIQNEAVTDYLRKTAVLGETTDQIEARKRSLIEGMQVATFLLLPGGVSQAVACNGNIYTIDHTRPIALPGSLPL